MLESKEIIHVSIEAYCKRGHEPTDQGWICAGLFFVGLALLTKDVLPGIPLTRIVPVESIVEYVHVKVTEAIRMKENKETTQKKSTDVEPCNHEAIIVGQVNEISGLKKKLQEETKTVADQKLKITDLKREIRTLDEKLRSSESKTIADLNLKVSELKREQRDFKETIRTLEAKLDAAGNEKSIKESRVEELEHEIDEATKKTSNFESRLSEVRTLHEKLTDEHTDLVAENTKTQRKMEIQKDTIDNLTGELESMQQKLDECSEKRFKASSANVKLTTTLASRNEEILKKQNQIDVLGEKVKKAKRVGRICVKL